MNENNSYNRNDIYKPKNKKERAARRHLFERFQAMRDDPQRKEQEELWRLGDEMFSQYMPPREEGDWQAHITLPDTFAAIQTYMQETIDRRSRPYLMPANIADDAVERFVNAIMNYSMDKTGYDYQEFLSKSAAAIRGTSFRIEYYRVEKRDVHDITGIDEDGSLKYEEKEITDFDDAYTEFVENEYIFVDPSARSDDGIRDFIHREIMDIERFKSSYGKKPEFMNVDKVQGAGTVSDGVSFFDRPKDLTDNEVEILHYYNRDTDTYDVLANNVLIRMGYLPSKHKELGLAVDRHYTVPGRIWGIGLPKVIYSLTEERTSLRNLNLDRQHLQTNKVFLVNDLVDLDEDEVRTRPHGLISVNTNGLPLSQVIQPLEYGDTPMSNYKTEDMLLEDIRRAHGMSDQLQGNSVGGTATEAAILKEASQRRINLINTVSEMNTVTRLGKLKWSNVQFFYKAPRVEKITVDRKTRTKKNYRSIRVDGAQFEITTDEGTNKSVLKSNDYDGTSNFTLHPKMARFMDGDFDVVMNAEAHSSTSKPIKQAKITEMFNTIAINPQLMAVVDPQKAVKRYITVNDEAPDHWMRDKGMTDEEWQAMAQHENQVMAQGQPIGPTKDATEKHTMEHLAYTETVEYKQLVEQNPAIETIFMQHIMGEHEANPSTGSADDAMSGAEATGDSLGATPPNPDDISMTPTSPGGADAQDSRQQAVA